MKKSCTTLLTCILIFSLSAAKIAAQSPDMDITHTLEQFAQAADANNTNRLEQLLANSFRIVWPQSDAEPFIVDRSTYLDKIKTKEWGGDQRKLNIHWIKTNGDHSTAYVQLTGKADMHSFLDLVKIKGQWQISQDAVQMK